ncbi:hypothetical protein B0H14DRAFT_2599805 [Mycena olivaceomarginata]|nr:hypothetical protein B0H14DRAFT_2599805 [Mycena olivaceomarginata]
MKHLGNFTPSRQRSFCPRPAPERVLELPAPSAVLRRICSWALEAAARLASSSAAMVARAQRSGVVDGGADTALEGPLELCRTMQGCHDTQLAEKATELAPRLAAVGRGGDVETPSDGVGVVDNKDDAMDSDRRTESSPCLPRGDLRSEGVAVGLYKLRDLAVALDGSADKIPRGVRAHDGVGEREAGENPHKANDWHVVWEGVQGDVRGGQDAGVDDPLRQRVWDIRSEPEGRARSICGGGRGSEGEGGRVDVNKKFGEADVLVHPDEVSRYTLEQLLRGSDGGCRWEQQRGQQQGQRQGQPTARRQGLAAGAAAGAATRAGSIGSSRPWRRGSRWARRQKQLRGQQQGAATEAATGAAMGAAAVTVGGCFDWGNNGGIGRVQAATAGTAAEVFACRVGAAAFGGGTGVSRRATRRRCSLRRMINWRREAKGGRSGGGDVRCEEGVVGVSSGGNGRGSNCGGCQRWRLGWGGGRRRGGKASPEISTTEAGEEGRADSGVRVTSRDSMGTGVESLSHPNASAVWEGAGEGLYISLFSEGVGEEARALVLHVMAIGRVWWIERTGQFPVLECCIASCAAGGFGSMKEREALLAEPDRYANLGQRGLARWPASGEGVFVRGPLVLSQGAGCVGDGERRRWCGEKKWNVLGTVPYRVTPWYPRGAENLDFLAETSASGTKTGFQYERGGVLRGWGRLGSQRLTFCGLSASYVHNITRGRVLGEVSGSGDQQASPSSSGRGRTPFPTAWEIRPLWWSGTMGPRNGIFILPE